MQFARLLVDRGKPGEALALSDQSVRIWTATLSPSSTPAAQARAIHAYALAHLGRPREAAEELEAALPILIKSQGADDPSVRRAQSWLKAVRPQSAQTASTAQ
jgi:hypothetical protein